MLGPNLKSILAKGNLVGRGFELHCLATYAIVYGMEPRLVLEFGAGHSSYFILAALADLDRGRLISIDKRPPPDDMPKALHDRLDYWYGKFIDFHDAIGKYAYDVFLHDGSHTASVVREELSLVIPRMRQNGIILVHDTFGAVDRQFSNLTDKIFDGMPGDLECVTLPYGYGLTIARVRKDFGNGTIKTTWVKDKIA